MPVRLETIGTPNPELRKVQKNIMPRVTIKENIISQVFFNVRDGVSFFHSTYAANEKIIAIILKIPNTIADGFRYIIYLLLYGILL